jgi:eukaryotic-like serine/threonine-protein kinase
MQLPTSIGKYELIEFLGGGMSQVYRARDTVIDRPVVVKILTLEASSDSEAKARFLQEARVAGNIQHENIVSVFDFGEHEGRPFIVMEYLKGVDLRAAMRDGSLKDAANGGLIPCLKIALQIATALEYVHQLGVVHRDIKPENINLDPSGRAKLMDFGIAKTANLSLTRTGMAMGTPYYMAPEQVSGRPAAPQVDIYAWGMLVFELLTGLRAVNGSSMEAVFYQILNQPLDESVMEKVGVPKEIRALILQATAKDPQARPQSFAAVIASLKSFLSAQEGGPAQAASREPSLAQPPSEPPALQKARVRERESPKVPILRLSAVVYGAVTLVTLLAVGVWFWIGKPGAGGKLLPSSTGAYAKAMVQGMVYIPGGRFLAGADKHPVQLNPYYIDATEVTAGDYCDLMPCEKPPKDEERDLPMVNITIAQARSYAMRVGKRLPTPLEWERAARGVNGNLYPWGDAEDPTLANVRDNPSFGGKELVPVKSFQGYAASGGKADPIDGLYQMVGNAWEFVEGPVNPSPEAVERFAKLGLLKPPPTASEQWVSVRGGSFTQPLAPNIVYDSLSIPARFSAADIGFRLVKDVTNNP